MSREQSNASSHRTFHRAVRRRRGFTVYSVPIVMHSPVCYSLHSSLFEALFSFVFPSDICVCFLRVVFPCTSRVFPHGHAIYLAMHLSYTWVVLTAVLAHADSWLTCRRVDTDQPPRAASPFTSIRAPPRPLPPRRPARQQQKQQKGQQGGQQGGQQEPEGVSRRAGRPGSSSGSGSSGGSSRRRRRSGKGGRGARARARAWARARACCRRCAW